MQMLQDLHMVKHIEELLHSLAGFMKEFLMQVGM